MFSFACIFLFAIAIVFASFILSSFLIGISRYMRDDSDYISIEKWGHYGGCNKGEKPVIHCPEYRPGIVDFEYAHVSGPWHG